jgi:hypothetical protein
MPRRRESHTAADYWKHRLRSKAFKANLTALLERELKSLAQNRVCDVVDPALVRTLIREWDGRLLNPQAVADLLIAGQRGAARRAQAHGQSILARLDPQLVRDLDALLKEDFALSADAEAFVASLMQQEFIRRLFMEIIFTAIVAFNRRVNPLFGAFTTRVLEDQIKGFIRLFMPMLQQQATAFVISTGNQRFLLDLMRSIVRELLDVPLPRYVVAISPAERKKLAALIRKTMSNARLESLVREAALAAWDDLYASIERKKIGDLLQLDEHAARLARSGVELILPALTRRGVLEFIAAEVGRTN